MYNVFLRLKNTAVFPSCEISFSSEYSIAFGFRQFVCFSCDKIEESYYFEEISDSSFLVRLSLRDLNANALISFLNFICHFSNIFYNSNFNFLAIYNFECDLEKMISDFPF